MALRFGTDGVRGRDTELTPEWVAALGRAAASALGGERFVIGRDTRRSGPMIESALAAGLAASGVDVERLGVVPTPAVAWLSATENVPGVVISASHNPYTDNGVKLFAPGGRKLAEEVELRLEGELERLRAGGPASSAGGTAIGTVTDRDVSAAYTQALVGLLEGRRLDGLSIVLDPANGAASAVGPEVLRRLGADVRVIHAEPDGLNINAGCGSTAPGELCRTVVATGADLGLALDGDADRVHAVDHRGELVDGDQLLAMFALDLRRRDHLRDATVVVTVMTNLGFRRAMAEHGVTTVETPVGDRHVLAALERGQWSLGGEQSGHIIFRDLATTGDGVLSGVLLADLVRRAGRPLAELAAAAMTRLPQVLRGVAVERRPEVLPEAVAAEVATVEAELGGSGRVLVRPSGTEPMVRIMVEAPTPAQAEDAAERLVAAVERACTAPAGSEPR
ncbi:MAG: phosphoglucosamine mutase [Actinobacteria bacterium]|nr:phosphoglucosamine mutase [Actinomycetota bacterium]